MEMGACCRRFIVSGRYPPVTGTATSPATGTGIAIGTGIGGGIGIGKEREREEEDGSIRRCRFRAKRQLSQTPRIGTATDGAVPE